MKRNGIILIATLIAMMFAGQVFGQDKFIVTASSPDATEGSIPGGAPFSVQINMDNDGTTDLCGANFSFKLYSPDGSITEITHVDVGGDATYPSVEFINGFATMMNFLIIAEPVNTDMNGTLPDKIAWSFAGMNCLPAAPELTPYIKFNIQIDAGTVATGTFCIDSLDAAGGGNGDWDWVFPPEHLPVTFNGPYCWSITNLTEVTMTSSETDVLPTDFALDQNYPNPFNPSTTFDFALPKASQVNIEIFNVLGQKVKTLADAEYPAGFYSVNWDGMDDNGSNVASGIYFYRMNTEEFQDTKKLMLLK
ncbi:MAG: T9SS type A sorting domain-containing protein [candidate division Zixibacteria bacterium]|nr:T9SS type A sorting domain-containing protein [candidate division Zixibacteria bacterium]